MNGSRKSLQDTYAPHSICFGCGPANEAGLQIKSFVEGDVVVAEWSPQPMYQAFEGMLNGGIIGALLDCHCNWTAAYHLMRQMGLDKTPCTVTAEYKVSFLAPTNATSTVALSAKVVKLGSRSADVYGELSAGGEVTATCDAVFVSVKPDHPAYHRW